MRPVGKLLVLVPFVLAACAPTAPFAPDDSLDASAELAAPAPDVLAMDTAPVRDAAVDAFSWGDGAPCLPTGEVTRGRAAAVAHCTLCHGGDLGGGLSMYEPPGSDLHNDGRGYGGRSDCDLQAAVRRGLDQYGYPLCIKMPMFSTSDVSDQDLGDIYAYMRSLTLFGTLTAVCN